MPVKESELEPLTQIAEGGFGVVFRVGNYLLPGDPTPLAYKRFKQDHAAAEAINAAAAVEFRATRNADEIAVLDTYTTWPRALVVDEDDNVCGLLMPVLEDRFFCSLIDYQTGQPGRKPRDMSWLIARQSTRDAAEIELDDIDDGMRLFLLAQLVFTLGWLHKQGWVFGDLSFKNVVFDSKSPQIMLIDCDSAADVKNKSRKQYSTPNWEPPESRIKPKEDQQILLLDYMTDVYKLGLAILRCLTPGNGASNTRDISRLRRHQLDDGSRALLHRALSNDPNHRPKAKELYSALRLMANQMVAAPEIITAQLTTPFRIRGQDVHIEWELKRADHVTVTIGTKSLGSVKYKDTQSGHAFWTDQSGPVTIEAGNNYGTATMYLGNLTLYELPQFNVDLSHLPRPELPYVEATPVRPLATILQGDPAATVSYPKVPEVGPPQLFDFTDSLNPEISVPAPGPQIDKALIDASNAITRLIAFDGESIS
jgi:serine/threonine protein kinase